MNDRNNFIDIIDIPSETIISMLKKAKACKQHPKGQNILQGKSLAMFFAKPSTRTRFSFESAMRYLGGTSISVNGADIGFPHREEVKDFSHTISLFNDAICARVYKHSDIYEFVNNTKTPIINTLSNHSHPCQALADFLTIIEEFGYQPVPICWVGDINNVCVSLMQLAVKLGWSMTVSCPKVLLPKTSLDTLSGSASLITWEENVDKAVENKKIIICDTWISLENEHNINPHTNKVFTSQEKTSLLSGWQVNSALIKKARNDAIVLHCLPAKRGKEITANVIDGLQSRIWQEALNRKYTQISILAWAFNKLNQLKD